MIITGKLVKETGVIDFDTIDHGPGKVGVA